ncbi:MAG: hypothetical protein KDE34_09460, partial [Anaerolineales bacterium]|nr:hypothetical protein [Anaerolineales bacterium]
LIRAARPGFNGLEIALYELAQRRPLRYLNLCRQLFEAGAFQLNGQLLEPSALLRQSRPPHGARSVDWFIMASLHEAGHKSDTAELLESTLGIVPASTMTYWVEALLEILNVGYQSTVNFGAWEALYRAAQLRQRNEFVLALVKATLLGERDPPLLGGNLWASILACRGQSGPLPDPNENRLVLTLYCRGARLQIQPDRQAIEANLLGVLWEA